MFNNFAEWLVSDASRRDNPFEKTPDRLSRRLMSLDFAAVHTATITTANMVTDTASCSKGRTCLTAVSAECQEMNAKYGSQWSPSRLTEVVVTNSALRESMRLSGFSVKVSYGR